MSGQGFRTRVGWTTAQSPQDSGAHLPESLPAPSWAWAIVMLLTSAAIVGLVWVDGFKP